MAIKRAAPGTLFSLFGSLVIGVAVFKGVNVETTRELASKDNNQAQQQIHADQVADAEHRNSHAPQANFNSTERFIGRGAPNQAHLPTSPKPIEKPDHE